MIVLLICYVVMENFIHIKDNNNQSRRNVREIKLFQVKSLTQQKALRTISVHSSEKLNLILIKKSKPPIVINSLYFPHYLKYSTFNERLIL